LARQNFAQTACLLLLVASAATRAETIYHNVHGYTSTPDGIHAFAALVVDDAGKVVATGDDALLDEYPGAQRVDGAGRTLLPGLIDAHGHIVGYGRARASLDLVGVASVEAARERIAAHAAANPASRWLLGRGWNQVIWPVRAFPTAADIDAVVADRPVWLERIDGHAGWANSATMALAGIDDDTPDPVGGKIIRDQNGHATGIFVDNAMQLIDRIVPAPGKPDVRRWVLGAVDALLAEGITSVHDAGIDLQTAEVYLSLVENGELDLRIYAMIGGADEVLDAIAKPIVGLGEDRLSIASVKLYADGALGSRGAALIEPYDDDAENRGLPFWTQAELDAMVEKANRMGFQVGIHAIGDLGNRMALDAFANAQGGKPSPLRNRIEHSQVVSLEDIPRFAELGVIASMEATHATSDMNMAEDRVGAERILGAYAWRRMLDAGVVIANGSDFPVELSNPFHGLYAAVSRKDRNGLPADGWYADQALTRAEALHSFTLAAAYAGHQEDRLGSLEPGKWADFIIIDRDYFTVPEDEIDDIRVIETWIAGKKVFGISSDGPQQ